MITDNKTQYVPIDRIVGNSLRNFTLNPIKEAKLADLEESMDRNGVMGAIDVRLLPDGNYEQAYGHHRVAQMKKRGEQYVRCIVTEISDAGMLTMMIDENSTQNGGDPASQADSVEAAAYMLAYWLFISENEATFREISLKVEGFFKPGGFSTAKGRLINRGELGRTTLVNLVGTGNLRDDVARNRIAEMQDSGRIEVVIKKAKARADKEIAAEIAAEKAESDRADRAAARAKKAKAAAEAEDARLEKEQAILKQKRLAAKARADKAAIKEREEQAKQEQIRLRATARVREKEIAKREKERKVEAKKQVDQKARLASIKKAADAAEKTKADAWLHPEITQLFENDGQLRAFRDAVKESKDVLPVKDQPALAKKIIDGLMLLDNHVSARGVTEMVREEAGKRDKVARERFLKIEADNQKRKEEHAVSNKATRIHKELEVAMGRMDAVCAEIQKNLGDEEFMEAFIRQPNGLQTAGRLNSLHANLPAICAALQVAEHRVSKTIHVEKEIN